MKERHRRAVEGTRMMSCKASSGGVEWELTTERTKYQANYDQKCTNTGCDGADPDGGGSAVNAAGTGSTASIADAGSADAGSAGTGIATSDIGLVGLVGINGGR